MPAQNGTAVFSGAGRLVLSDNYNYFRARLGAVTEFAVDQNQQFLPLIVLMNGGGGLSASAQLGLIAFGTFVGSGLLLPVAAQQDSAIFAGAGSLSSLSIQTDQDAAAFNGGGSLSASATLNEAAFAEFDGAGSFSATASSTSSQIIAFIGSGSLTASTIQTDQVTAIFAGAGNLKVTSISHQSGTANFNGSGSLSSTGSLGLKASAVFAGSGVVQVGFIKSLASATFAGNGKLVFNDPYNYVRARLGAVAEFALDQQQQILAFLVRCNGAGSLSVSASIGGRIQFAGAGGLTSNSLLIHPTPVIFAGGGSLSCNFSAPILASVTFAGNGRFGFRDTYNYVNASLGAVTQFALDQQQQFIVNPTLPIPNRVHARLGAVVEFAVGQWQPLVVNVTVFSGRGGMCVSAYVRKGSQGITINKIVTGPGIAKALIIQGT